jgi:hypothetical protein
MVKKRFTVTKSDHPLVAKLGFAARQRESATGASRTGFFEVVESLRQLTRSGSHSDAPLATLVADAFDQPHNVNLPSHPQLGHCSLQLVAHRVDA